MDLCDEFVSSYMLLDSSETMKLNHKGSDGPRSATSKCCHIYVKVLILASRLYMSAHSSTESDYRMYSSYRLLYIRFAPTLYCYF